MEGELAHILASAAAGEIGSELRERIKSSNSGEKTWKSACYQVAIKVRSSFEQNQKSGTADDTRFQRDLDRFGSIARELAIIGDEKSFDRELVGKLNQLADGCASIVDSVSGIGNTLEPKYHEENIPSIIEYIIEETSSSH